MTEAAFRLRGVPQSMLWTLYCRARQARSGRLQDPDAIEVMNSLEKFGTLPLHFGYPDPALAKRALLFDQRAQPFLSQHPQSEVLALGEGLETQRSRLRGYGRWTSVDLPEAMEIRDRLYPPGPNHRHIGQDVLTLDWSTLGLEGPTLVIAQGLFMYLPLPSVKDVIRACANLRGPTLLLFDVVPPWVFLLSRFRPPVGPRFRIPKMAWGARPGPLRRLVRDVLGPSEQDAKEDLIHDAPSSSAAPDGRVRPYQLDLLACPLPGVPLRRANTRIAAIEWSRI